MCKEFVVLSFLSLTLLAGCSSDSDISSNSDVSNTLLATFDKSAVTVNGVRVYSNAVPSQSLIYDSTGALISSSENTVESTLNGSLIKLNRTQEPFFDEDPSMSVDFLSYNEFGQLTIVESQSVQNGVATDNKEIIFEMIYDGEQLITELEHNATVFSGNEIFTRALVQTRYQQDGRGRVANASLFASDSQEPTHVWTREYSDSGWIETETGESLFSPNPDAIDTAVREVRVNQAGLIERIVETSEVAPGPETLSTDIFIETEVFNYDEQGRLSELLLFDEDGGLLLRIEYLDYQEIDVYLHDFINSSRSFGGF